MMKSILEFEHYGIRNQYTGILVTIYESDEEGFEKRVKTYINFNPETLLNSEEEGEIQRTQHHVFQLPDIETAIQMIESDVKFSEIPIEKLQDIFPY